MRTRKGFTLIELLVVIAIIAILAAILFPVFARARENARKANCLSNQKQIGLALMQYTQDWDEMYPYSYYYVNGSGGSGGYVHWSYLLQSYAKSEKMFVCPSDKEKGLLPTNTFDYQVPRISYISNEVLMGRPRAHFSSVSSAEVEYPSDLIAVAETTDYKYGIGGSSGPSGGAPKSHRPANAFTPWNNDSTYAASYQYVSYTDWAAAEASAAAAADFINDESQTHLRYCSSGRHNDGCNYVFADGHAKWLKGQQTINYRLWGTRFYSLANDAPIY